MSIEQLLWNEDATGLAQRIKAGDLSASEAVEAAIMRAERVNPDINAIAERLYDQARRQVAELPADAPLAGVPFAIKDLGIVQKGVPTNNGSRIPPFVPDFDSVLTERYRAAGLVTIATSTTPEFGLRLVTESAAFGTTRNPWNTAHTSGGSSGGAAALVAAGIVPVAHASDGGGSIRVPSSTTGLVGMKVSRGRTPTTPLTSESWYGFVVDHVVSRSVRDSALLLDLTHGPDGLAPYAARPPRRSFASAAARDPGTLTLAVYRQSPLGLPVSRETMEALDTAVALAREGGHSVEEISLPMIDRAFMADFCRIVASSIAGMLRTESARAGRQLIGSVERGSRIIARLGELLSAGEAYAALERLQASGRALLAHTARFDAVLMPLIAHPPVPVGGMDAKGADAFLEALLDHLRLTFLLRFDSFVDQLMDKSLWFTHWPAIQNVTGQPAISLPVHVTDDGLPLGVQAVGRPGDEETLFSLAAQLENISGWRSRRAQFHLPA